MQVHIIGYLVVQLVVQANAGEPLIKLQMPVSWRQLSGLIILVRTSVGKVWLCTLTTAGVIGTCGLKVKPPFLQGRKQVVPTCEKGRGPAGPCGCFMR